MPNELKRWEDVEIFPSVAHCFKKRTKMKIQMNKKYKTRSGKDVRILCIDKGGRYPVVGIVDSDVIFFTETGVTWLQGNLDLVEISPFADFKDGDPVMVRNRDDEEWDRRYFHSLTEVDNRLGGCRILVYKYGATKWSGKETNDWAQCRRPTAEELQ